MNSFDVLVGKWDVHNRTITASGVSEFPSRCEVQRMFDGHISVDETVFPTRGTRGLALRLFDPQTELWSIYWVDSRTMMPGTRCCPRRLRRWDSTDSDGFTGLPSKLRFTWSDITPTSARWQQELSEDDGQTWEVNWVMEFTRA